MKTLINFFKRLFGIRSVAVELPKHPDVTPLESSPVESGSVTPGIIRTMSEAERLAVMMGFYIANKVIKSSEFETEVLKYKFSDTGGKTNHEILEAYRNINAKINVELFTGNFYQNRISKTNAYELNAEGFIRINRHFVYTPLLIASCLMHELGHNPLGFSHPGLSQTSVNYGMNEILERVAKGLGYE